MAGTFSSDAEVCAAVQEILQHTDLATTTGSSERHEQIYGLCLFSGIC